VRKRWIASDRRQFRLANRALTTLDGSVESYGKRVVLEVAARARCWQPRFFSCSWLREALQEKLEAATETLG